MQPNFLWNNYSIMHLTVTMTIRVNQYQNVFILDFTGAKEDGCGDENWS